MRGTTSAHRDRQHPEQHHDQQHRVPASRTAAPPAAGGQDEPMAPGTRLAPIAMTSDRASHVLISAGAGLITVPVLDVSGLAGVHVALIKTLSDYYGVQFSDHTARNIHCAGTPPG